MVVMRLLLVFGRRIGWCWLWALYLATAEKAIASERLRVSG